MKVMMSDPFNVENTTSAATQTSFMTLLASLFDLFLNMFWIYLSVAPTSLASITLTLLFNLVFKLSIWFWTDLTTSETRSPTKLNTSSVLGMTRGETPERFPIRSVDLVIIQKSNEQIIYDGRWKSKYWCHDRDLFYHYLITNWNMGKTTN